MLRGRCVVDSLAGAANKKELQKLARMRLQDA
jgi:hypothetical protein